MEEVKIAMVNGASTALRYKRENPSASNEEISQYVMRKAKGTGAEKVATMVGASKALGMVDKNTSVTEREIIKNIVESGDEILKNMMED